MAAAHSPRQPRAASSSEPHLASIPEAWFLMGSTSGQDCERPVHRVWIDAFLLAATQVTNAEYERFAASTASDFHRPAAASNGRLLVGSAPILPVAIRANRPPLPSSH